MKIIYDAGTWTMTAATTPDAYIDESAYIGAASQIKITGDMYRPVTWIVRTLKLQWTNVGTTVANYVIDGTDSIAKSGNEVYLVDFGSYTGTYFCVPNSVTVEYTGYNFCNVSFSLESKVITNDWTPIT